MASANFADVYNAYQEYMGSEKRIQALSWTDEKYKDQLLTFSHFTKSSVKQDGRIRWKFLRQSVYDLLS